MPQFQPPNANQVRISGKGLEAVPAGTGGKVSGGFGDKKKVIILLVLGAVACAIVAYQFLGGKGPKPAAAKTSKTTKAAGQGGMSTDAVSAALKQLDAPRAKSGDDVLSVDRVENLVNKFDTYVQERQVPLAALRANPFQVEAPTQDAAAVAEPERDLEAETEARRQQMLKAARNLKLGAVLIAGGERSVIIGGRLYRVGDVVEGLRIAAVQSDYVTLAFENETVELRLRPESQPR